MPRIPEEFIDSLIDKVDIVDVISDYVALKKTGSKYVGLCPFHNEKTPSFTVDGDKQLFYCFGCHVGGNLIGFLEKKENLTFMETVAELARRANVPMPEFTEAGRPSISRETRQRVLEANREAARFYYSTLFEEEGAQGLEYLMQRGLTKNIINRFGLGFAPDSRDRLLHYLGEKGFEPELLVQAGLAVKNDFGVRDFFRARVMFPIISVTGDVLGFGGRVMDHSKPKYLNTNDTPVFNKRKNLYSLNVLKKNNRKRAIIGEGYMDVIALNMAGFDYGVASLGTAVTPEQVHLLQRYAQEIYVCYDGDEAGISATHKVIDLMKAEGLKPKIISLPVGVDPDEFIKASGAPAFAAMMESARTSIEYLMDEQKEKLDLSDEQGRAAYAQQAVAIIEKYAFDGIETEMYLKRLHRESGFSMEALYGNMENKPKGAPEKEKHIVDSGLYRKFDDATERALIAVLTEHNELIAPCARLVTEEHFASRAYRTVFARLLAAPDKASLRALMNEFEEDPDVLTALSAVGIEATIFGEPASFMRDCCRKMKMDTLLRRRDELSAQMERAAGAQEQIEVAGKMTALDKEIKQIRSEFKEDKQV